MFNIEMHPHKLNAVESEWNSLNSIILAIFVPKIIKVGENLRKF